ncbi:MAG TPA: rod shape-determining protein MreC [Candidatus Limnocylindrales bacterium]
MSSPARRQVALYVALLTICLLLLAFSSSAPLTEMRRGVGFAMAPIQNVLRGAGQGFSSFFGALGEIDQLRQQNQALQTQVNELQTENQSLESLRAQNQQLTDILQVRSSLAYESTAAEVISRRITDQEHVISLDRGSSAGIQMNDPVVGGGGALVGQVVEVGANYSRVLLITDTRMNVVGLLETSRGVGTVHGQLDRPLEMDGISATNQVNLGETVVTAGIELSEDIRSPYPKGLLIGTVADVERSPDQLFQTALVSPAANFETLEYVLVITNYQGGLPAISPEPSVTP